MAEAGQEKTPSLAEQWSVQDKQEQSNTKEIPAETPSEEKAEDAPAQEVVQEKTEEVSAVEESANVAEESATIAEESALVVEENVPAEEESSETPVEEEAEVPEATEEEPAIKLETAPADYRFPTTNQTRHCFTRYIEYHRCIAAKGEDAPECEKFAKYYRSLCPSEWVERWNEQRENGTFPGPL